MAKRNELERKEKYIGLLDMYGNLLGKAQYRRMSLHYSDDYSLAEIAQSEGISKNAVHLSIATAEKKLDQFEKKLGLVERLKTVRGLLDKIDEATGAEKARCLEEIRRILSHGI